MLVLTRKPNQQLHIGNDIVITVVKVRGNTIRLGIEAPKDVRIRRSELEIKIDKTQLADLLGTGVAVEAATDEVAAVEESVGACALLALSKAQAQASTANQSRSGSRGARSQSRSALKSFMAPKHPLNSGAGRNLEDSPLCHRAPLSQRAGIKLTAHA